MSQEQIIKLKTTIYEKLQHLNDATALQMVEEAVTAYSVPYQDDVLDELTDGQLQRLHKSMVQAEENRTISNEEVKKKANEWLSK